MFILESRLQLKENEVKNCERTKTPRIQSKTTMQRSQQIVGRFEETNFFIVFNLKRLETSQNLMVWYGCFVVH